jgi:hypothetical protein
VSDLLDQGSKWLSDLRRRHCTVPVVYARGADQVELPATIGRSNFAELNAFGILERVMSRDYLVTAADLVLGGVPVNPERGDRIVEERDGRRHTYEVLAPNGKPHWRWSDSYHRTYRIHTKLVKTEVL